MRWKELRERRKKPRIEEMLRDAGEALLGISRGGLASGAVRMLSRPRTHGHEGGAKPDGGWLSTVTPSRGDRAAAGRRRDSGCPKRSRRSRGRPSSIPRGSAASRGRTRAGGLSIEGTLPRTHVLACDPVCPPGPVAGPRCPVQRSPSLDRPFPEQDGKSGYLGHDLSRRSRAGRSPAAAGAKGPGVFGAVRTR